MAIKKGNEKEESVQRFHSTMADIARRNYRPVYVLCGEEPYYADKIISALSEQVLTPAQKEFNFSMVYGTDTDAGQIVCLCRRYPVESDKQLIIVREAQQLSSLQPFEYYLASPAPDTILVLAFTGKGIDKRTGFYKKLSGKAEVLESYALSEWQIPSWVTEYVREQGYSIEPAAAQLLAQSVGTGLRQIVLEIDKLFKGTDGNRITVRDVEVNVGVSREYNAFELCRAIAEKNRAKCFSIAGVLGTNPKKYPIQVTIGALCYYFSTLLQIEAVMADANAARSRISFFEAAAKCKVFGTREKEFEIAAANYPMFKTMGIISSLKECDLKSKSTVGSLASDGALLNELLAKILL